MPPAALISSTASFMPLLTGTPQPLMGPDRSWWVPIVISSAEIPWLVTLVCANAGAAANASSTAAKVAFDSRLHMRFLLFRSAFNLLPIRLEPPCASANVADADSRARRSAPVLTSCRLAIAVHHVDFIGVLLVHERAF